MRNINLMKTFLTILSSTILIFALASENQAQSVGKNPSAKKTPTPKNRDLTKPTPKTVVKTTPTPKIEATPMPIKTPETPLPPPIPGKNPNNPTTPKSEKKRLAIIAFENRSNRWWKGDWDGGASLASILSYLLTNEKIYDIVDYTKADKLKELQDLSKNGRFSRETALSVGKLKSANVAAVGEILLYDVIKKSAGDQYGKKQATFGVVTIYVTLYDAETGEPIGSAKAEGISKPQKIESSNGGGGIWRKIPGFPFPFPVQTGPTITSVYSENPLQTFMIEASENALKKIVQQLLVFNEEGKFGDKGEGIKRTVEGKVLDFDKKNQKVVLDLTRYQGVQVGDVFGIIKKEKCLTNDAGEVVKCKETEVAQVKITSVTETYSEGEVIVGGNIKKQHVAIKK